jgi:broad specificity phosphatase PhoE
MASMGTLYFVRHGQASFGAADYDQLSDLGQRQCERLGQWFAARQTRFDGVYTGTLKRHRQSLAAIALGGSQALPSSADAGLNEYHSEAVVRCVHPQPLAAPASPEEVRQHFRLLRQGLLAWMAGSARPAGMPSFADFREGVHAVMRQVQAHHSGGTSLIVSSGGPISTAMGIVLGLAPEAIVELNLHLRNSAVCELRVSPSKFSLVTFNTLPHLDDPALAGWITHA